MSEKLKAPEEENNNIDEKDELDKYPPFDPENAKRLIAEEKAKEENSKSAEDERSIEDVLSSENIDKTLEKFESIPEHDLENVLTIINNTRPNVARLAGTVRGNETGQRYAGGIASMVEGIAQQTKFILDRLQSGQEYDDEEALESAYKDKINNNYLDSTRGVQELQNFARRMPGQLAQVIMFDTQAISRNMAEINKIINGSKKKSTEI